jgi:hypothetical protein
MTPRTKKLPSPIGEWLTVHFTHYTVIGCVVIQITVGALSFHEKDVAFGLLSTIPAACLVWFAIRFHTHIHSFVSLSQLSRDFLVRPVFERFATGDWAFDLVDPDNTRHDLSFADRVLAYRTSTRYLWIAILDGSLLLWTFLVLTIGILHQ